MTLATNTSPGEIILDGDLAGNGGSQVGSNPQLTHISGLVPGEYVLPTVTIDAKGRITSIEEAVGVDLASRMPAASTTTAGVFKLGTHIYSDALPAELEVNVGGAVQSSTATAFDGCTEFLFDIVVNGGVTQTIEVTSSATTYGTLVSTINSQLNDASVSISNGNLLFVTDGAGDDKTLSITRDLLFCHLGAYVSTGTPVAGQGSCAIYVKDASKTEFGVAKIGSGISVVNGVISLNPSALNLTPATESELGGIKVGNGLDITVDGVLSVDATEISFPIATTTTNGTVKVPTGNGLSVDVLGNLSAVDATSNTKGVASIGSGLQVNAGVVSLNLPVATNSVLGGVKKGVGVNIDANGVLTVDASSFPIATSSTVGTVKVPTSNGLSVDGSGTLSYTPPTATTTTKGMVIVPTSGNLAVDGSGNLSVPKGTSTVYGVVKGSTDVVVTDGVITLSSNIARLNQNQTFTKSQTVAPVTLTGTNPSIDFTQSNIFIIDLTAGRVSWTDNIIPNPTGVTGAGVWHFLIRQNGIQHSFGTMYKFVGAVTPTASIAGLRDLITILSTNDGSLYCSVNKGYA